MRWLLALFFIAAGVFVIGKYAVFGNPNAAATSSTTTTLPPPTSAPVATTSTTTSTTTTTTVPVTVPRSTLPNGFVMEANAWVDHVVDGDTVDIMIAGRQERLRLIGIDTPEIAHGASGDRPAQEAECYGAEAAAFTSGLIPPGTPIWVERDVVGEDDYGRTLGYVYRALDGVFVNYELARQGYAEPLSIAPNEAHRDRIVEAARQAQRDEAGLWRACP